MNTNQTNQLISMCKSPERPTDRKMLYVFAGWVIKGMKEKTLTNQKIQNKVNGMHHQHNDYFRKYYHKKSTQEKSKLSKLRSKKNKTNKKQLTHCRYQQRKMSIIKKLYDENRLSPISNKLIKKELKKLKV